jgi:hypothetical protein
VAPFARVLLVFLPLAAATFAAFWLGVVPRTLSPLSPLSLEKRDQWFIDLKLAGLRLDPVLCQSVLKQPYVGATPVQDTPPTNGCGWINSVRFSEIGGANMSVQPLTCEMTAALTLWVTHEVQAAAKAIFGSPVARIDHMGTYRCRNIEGKHRRSEHRRRTRSISPASLSRTAGRFPSYIIGKTTGPRQSFFAERKSQRAVISVPPLDQITTRLTPTIFTSTAGFAGLANRVYRRDRVDP